MLRFVRGSFLFVLFFLAFGALAEDFITTIGEVKAKGGQKLSKGDLDALIPGTSMGSETEKVTRTWLHEKGGKLVGSFNPKPGAGNQNIKNTTGLGAWKVSDDGRLCVEIEWPRSSEKWCRLVYKVGSGYVGFGNDTEDDAKGHRFTLRK